MIRNYDSFNHWAEKLAALVVAWYIEALSDTELVKRIYSVLKTPQLNRNDGRRMLNELLVQLGEKPEKVHSTI